MKRQLSQISVILITLIFSGCFDPPIFLDEPQIEYKSLRYINYPSGTTGARDSLILRFEFQDGDGNIGLDDRFTFYPYHPYNLIVDSRDSLVTVTDNSLVPPFYIVDPAGSRSVYSTTGERPAYNDCDYSIVGSDTLLKVDNEHSRNFHVDFFIKRRGEYSKLNFQEIVNSDKCEDLTFDARIPIFNEEGQGKAQTGTYTYDMYSRLWELALSTDTFKIQFYIYDRALNKSNVEESPDITLPGIMVNRN